MPDLRVDPQAHAHRAVAVTDFEALRRALAPRQPKTAAPAPKPVAEAERWTEAAGYAAVDARSGGRCEHPDVCMSRAEIHHHIAGRRGPDPHHPVNLLALCVLCHLRTHANPEQSYTNGAMRKRLAS